MERNEMSGLLSVEQENRIKADLEREIREDIEEKFRRDFEHKMRKQIEEQVKAEAKKKYELNIAKEKAEREQRAKENEKVKGIFHFYECPGFSLKFSFKKYKGDQVETYDLQDGQVYTIPLKVAKHLNQNGWYPVHAFAKDEDGKPSMKINQKVRRFGFQSLEFMEMAGFDDASQKIVTVEYTGV